MSVGPANPFLADSTYPIAHGRSDQQDSIAGPGPEGPSEVLGDDDIQFTWLGSGNFGQLISGLYPDGRRVLWNHGRNRITKLDFDSLEELAALHTGGEAEPDPAEMERLTDGLDADDLEAALEAGIEISMRFFTGLEGVYALLDRDHILFHGDRIVKITLLWRDENPDDWEQLPDAPHRRIAGIGPAHMGDPTLTEVKTEQSITVSGYGAMTVNNEPASIPDGFPERAARMRCFMLGHRSEFTPRGLHKYAWNTDARRLEEAWVNTEVSSPNAVPFVAEGSGLVYTCGVSDGRWSIEALDWATGEERFHFVLGGSRFNTAGAGVTVDEEGRLLFGNISSKSRVLRGPAGLSRS